MKIFIQPNAVLSQNCSLGITLTCPDPTVPLGLLCKFGLAFPVSLPVEPSNEIKRCPEDEEEYLLAIHQGKHVARLVIQEVVFFAGFSATSPTLVSCVCRCVCVGGGQKIYCWTETCDLIIFP